MSKNRILLRVIALPLALCMMLAASPAAFATTPQQEAEKLTTQQRSLNNPEGGFTAPATSSRFWLLHPDTYAAGRLMLINIGEQLLTGSADPAALMRIMAYAPIIKSGDELPPHADFGELDTFQYAIVHGFCDVYIALRETETPAVYKIITLYTTRAGDAYYVPQNVLYNAETGVMTGEQDNGIIGIGFNYDMANQIVYTATGGWQRSMGYSILYDLAAPLLTIYFNTVRFPFNYDGKDWMVQIWKGIYGPSNGGEIGLYESSGSSTFFWDTSDTYLDMQMKIYQGERLLFDSGLQETWWLGMFRYGSPLFLPVLPARKLRMESTIVFEDPGMRDAFYASFEENKTSGMTGSLDGMTFTMDWAG